MNKEPLHVYFALCIFIRLLLIYFAFIFLHNNIGNALFTLLYALMGISILYQYISKIRTKGAFGQYIWWDFLRPLHAVLFLCASILIYKRQDIFIWVLLLDTFIGFSAYVYYHNVLNR